MLFSIFLAIFLPCVGMTAVFVVYMCLLCFVSGSRSSVSPHDQLPVFKNVSEEGLSVSDLEKLPKCSGKGLIRGTECAVCLDEIEAEQPARVIPGCDHGFHLQCVDTWLSKNSCCPVCRAKLPPQIIMMHASSDDSPC